MFKKCILIVVLVLTQNVWAAPDIIELFSGKVLDFQVSQDKTRVIFLTVNKEEGNQFASLLVSDVHGRNLVDLTELLKGSNPSRFFHRGLARNPVIHDVPFRKYDIRQGLTHNSDLSKIAFRVGQKDSDTSSLREGIYYAELDKNNKVVKSKYFRSKGEVNNLRFYEDDHLIYTESNGPSKGKLPTLRHEDSLVVWNPNTNERKVYSKSSGQIDIVSTQKSLVWIESTNSPENKWILNRAVYKSEIEFPHPQKITSFEGRGSTSPISFPGPYGRGIWSDPDQKFLFINGNIKDFNWLSFLKLAPNEEIKALEKKTDYPWDGIPWQDTGSLGGANYVIANGGKHLFFLQIDYKDTIYDSALCQLHFVSTATDSGAPIHRVVYENTLKAGEAKCNKLTLSNNGKFVYWIETDGVDTGTQYVRLISIDALNPTVAKTVLEDNIKTKIGDNLYRLHYRVIAFDGDETFFLSRTVAENKKEGNTEKHNFYRSLVRLNPTTGKTNTYKNLGPEKYVTNDYRLFSRQFSRVLDSNSLLTVSRRSSDDSIPGNAPYRLQLWQFGQPNEKVEVTDVGLIINGGPLTHVDGVGSLLVREANDKKGWANGLYLLRE